MKHFQRKSLYLNSVGVRQSVSVLQPRNTQRWIVDGLDSGLEIRTTKFFVAVEVLDLKITFLK